MFSITGYWGNIGEMLPHIGQNRYHQKIHKQQLLEKVWKEAVGPPALLVKMCIGATTVENSMEVP